MPLRRFASTGKGHFDEESRDDSTSLSASPQRRSSTVSTSIMTPPLPSFQRLGSPSQHAAAVLAHALRSRQTGRFGNQNPSDLNHSRQPQPSALPRPNVEVNSKQNEEITYDESSEQTPPPASDRQPLHRTTSESQNGSPPSAAWNNRRLRQSPRIHGSVSNVSEFTNAHMAGSGPLVVYQPDWSNHAMLSRAPSISQLYGFPPPPPLYPPYYLGAFPAPILPGCPPDPKTMRKAMKHAQKMEKKRRMEVELAMSEGGCAWYCCDGVAKLLWAIICITLVGFLAALFLAIYVL